MLKFLLVTSLALTSVLPQNLDTLIIENNRMKVGFINNGNIGKVEDSAGFSVGIRYDGIIAMYSAGLYLSGKNNGIYWSNGAFASDRIYDYLPGKFNNPSSANDKFYLVKSTDPDFGVSWQDWTNAVEQGASFYDGNDDGIYNPIDINENGKWDSNEDKPDLIGDFTAWNIFNDGVPGSERKMSGMEPLGIEVEQTIFGTLSDEISGLRDVIFIRYEINNAGQVADLLDSVYLGLAYDFDLGDHEDDLSGCDIEKNIGYFYNDSSDSPTFFGDTPPAAFVDLLEGPAVFLPNVTYLDNNNNGVYDNQIDTALDSAVVMHGPNLGVEYLDGAINLGMNSFTVYLSSLPLIGTPDSAEEVRNYLIGGRYLNGDSVIVRTFDIGNGKELGNYADSISNRYFFSGNPINVTGWLNTQPWDNRMLVNTGPFDLKAKQPVNIMFAIIMARGNDYLNSIEKAYESDDLVQEYYNNNFSDFPDKVLFGNNTLVPSEFILHQNYPNPFNPTTTIKYSVPYVASSFSSSKVELKVFDVLGREVKTLVNQKQKPGNYEVNFNSSNLSSGVYFYRLQSGDFIQTKKMILMR